MFPHQFIITKYHMFGTFWWRLGRRCCCFAEADLVTTAAASAVANHSRGCPEAVERNIKFVSIPVKKRRNFLVLVIFYWGSLHPTIATSIVEMPVKVHLQTMKYSHSKGRFFNKKEEYFWTTLVKLGFTVLAGSNVLSHCPFQTLYLLKF